MLLLCYFHFFLTDEGFLKKFIDSTKSLSPDEKGERLESDEVWDFLSLVLRETILVTGAENKCSATHCFHSSKFLLWCYFLSSFRDQLFFILSQNICEAHAACAQEGQTEVEIWQLKVLVHEFWKIATNICIGDYIMTRINCNIVWFWHSVCRPHLLMIVLIFILLPLFTEMVVYMS